MPHKDPAARREYERQWRAKNGAKIRDTKRRFYERNKEQQITRTRVWQDENPEQYSSGLSARNAARRFQKKGITKKQYDEMYLAQKGLCRLCENAVVPEDVQIDHCHKTGVVRGLLCRPCNAGLGMFKDDPEFLRKAIAYLEGSKL